MWRFYNMLLNNQCQIRRQKRNKNYLDTNENGDIQYQNLQDAAKVILGRKFIVVKANSEIKKYPKQPNFKLQGTRGKKEQTKLRVSRWKQIPKTGAINK